MNPNAHQPSREDVLDAFAVEPSHGREILERYLREYPHFSKELVDLSRELSRVPNGAERPISLQEQAMVEAAWQQHMPIETKSAKDPLADVSVTKLREIALQEVERLRSFIKSIDEEWIAWVNYADADEWNDGYEDALGMVWMTKQDLKGTDHDPE